MAAVPGTRKWHQGCKVESQRRSPHPSNHRSLVSRLLVVTPDWGRPVDPLAAHRLAAAIQTRAASCLDYDRGISRRPCHRAWPALSRASWKRTERMHVPCCGVDRVGMNSPSQRLNITLDEEHAAKLAQLAERVHVNEGLLDAIDGAYDRAPARAGPGGCWGDRRARRVVAGDACRARPSGRRGPRRADSHPQPSQWAGLRFMLGPWRWMLVVYRFDEADGACVVVTIQDARTMVSP